MRAPRNVQLEIDGLADVRSADVDRVAAADELAGCDSAFDRGMVLTEFEAAEVRDTALVCNRSMLAEANQGAGNAPARLGIDDLRASTTTKVQARRRQMKRGADLEIEGVGRRRHAGARLSHPAAEGNDGLPNRMLDREVALACPGGHGVSLCRH